MVENIPQSVNPQVEEDENSVAPDPKTVAQWKRIMGQQKRAEQLKRRERAGRALEASAMTTELASKGVKNVGKGVSKLGDAATKIPYVGPVIGIPLKVLGTGTKVAGQVGEVVSKKAKQAGQKIKQGAKQQQQQDYLRGFKRASKLAEKFGIHKDKIEKAKRAANLAKIAAKGKEKGAEKLFMSAFRKLYLAGIGTVFLIPIVHFFMSVHFFIKHWAHLDVKLLPKFQLVDFLILIGLWVLFILTTILLILIILDITEKGCWFGIEMLKGECQ